jgi:hypothetical protein
MGHFLEKCRQVTYPNVVEFQFVESSWPDVLHILDDNTQYNTRISLIMILLN